MRFLHVTEGPDQGASFALPDHEPQLIGRSTESLPITDREVSRRHAELTPDVDSWYVRDLDSTNGTLLNGEELLGSIEVHRRSRISIISDAKNLFGKRNTGECIFFAKILFPKEIQGEYHFVAPAQPG